MSVQFAAICTDTCVERLHHIGLEVAVGEVCFATKPDVRMLFALSKQHGNLAYI